MGAGIENRFLQGFDNKTGSRQVGITDSQINYIDTSSSDLILDPVDFFKEIRRELFEPFGKFKNWHVIKPFSIP